MGRVWHTSTSVVIARHLDDPAPCPLVVAMPMWVVALRGAHTHAHAPSRTQPALAAGLVGTSNPRLMQSPQLGHAGTRTAQHSSAPAFLSTLKGPDRSLTGLICPSVISGVTVNCTHGHGSAAAQPGSGAQRGECLVTKDPAVRAPHRVRQGLLALGCMGGEGGAGGCRGGWWGRNGRDFSMLMGHTCCPPELRPSPRALGSPRPHAAGAAGPPRLAPGPGPAPPPCPLRLPPSTRTPWPAWRGRAVRGSPGARPCGGRRCCCC